MSKEGTESSGAKNIESRERVGFRFLIVEDNSDNIQAAQEYLNQQQGELKITADIARDYDEAMELIEKGGYNGVITDLFFPKKIGSNDVSLGQRIVEEIEEMRKQPDFKNKIEEDTGVSLAFDRDLESLKNAVAMKQFSIAPGSRMKKDMGVNDQDAKVMPPSANNQPLGVRVAEKAKHQGIPYVIVTSGHGGHGDISTPVGVYLKEKGLINDFRGNFAGREGDRGLSDCVRNGQFVPFEEYEAKVLADEETGGFYHEHPEAIREDYESTVEYFESTTKQPFFTDAEKHRPEVWENVMKWMEYIAHKNSEKDASGQ